MKVIYECLGQAVEKNIISRVQADQLTDIFNSQAPQTVRLNLTNVLYYMGGLFAICAMSLFMGLGWEAFGGWGLLGFSLVYGAVGLTFAGSFKKRGAPVASGICAAFVIVLTPLALYGMMEALGLWPVDADYHDYFNTVRWYWVYLELGTLAVGVVMVYFYRYPFLQMPIVLTLWFLCLDLTSWIVGEAPGFSLYNQVSMYFGVAMIVAAFCVDIRAKASKGHAFWLYLMGVVAFWSGLSLHSSDDEISKLIYFCINLGLIGIGAVIIRRVFVIFGAIGCAIYLGHLAYGVFSDSWFFPAALSVIGFGIVWLGLLWQKHEGAINRKIRRRLPLFLGQFLEQRAE